MSDERLRGLERRASLGGVEEHAALIRERLRIEGLQLRRVELAAYCGCDAARMAIVDPHWKEECSCALFAPVTLRRNRHRRQFTREQAIAAFKEGWVRDIAPSGRPVAGWHSLTCSRYKKHIIAWLVGLDRLNKRWGFHHLLLRACLSASWRAFKDHRSETLSESIQMRTRLERVQRFIERPCEATRVDCQSLMNVNALPVWAHAPVWIASGHAADQREERIEILSSVKAASNEVGAEGIRAAIYQDLIEWTTA